jgi:hypothetical protein
MPELTITFPCVHSRVDSNTFTMGNHMPKSILTLCQSRLCLPINPTRDLGFGLCSHGPKALYTEKQTLKFRVSLFQYMLQYVKNCTCVINIYLVTFSNFHSTYKVSIFIIYIIQIVVKQTYFRRILHVEQTKKIWLHQKCTAKNS